MLDWNSNHVVDLIIMVPILFFDRSGVLPDHKLDLFNIGDILSITNEKTPNRAY